MNIVEINTLNFSSTGNIMLEVTRRLREQGHQVMVCYPATRNNLKKQVEGSYLVCGQIERNIGLNLSKLLGCDDLLFRWATRRLIRRMDRFGVDLIHLHNLHCWYINLPVLFRYIKKKGIRVVWTLHDCWPMTGHCPHFDMVGCDKWETGCHDCPQYREYPECLVDNSKRMYRVKKRALTGVPDLTLVTPSQWMAGIAARSFLKGYPVRVIYNGIDLSRFHPVENTFRTDHGCKDKFILLGVAMGWTVRKGVDVFIRLAGTLGPSFQIVLVGTDDKVDAQLPGNIISIHKTQDQRGLAEIYTAADLFVNPTREETLSLVSIESLACGTPVVMFNTGGCPETIDGTCGVVVEKDDVAAMESAILRIAAERPFTQEACRKRAERFASEDRYAEYIRLLSER